MITRKNRLEDRIAAPGEPRECRDDPGTIISYMPWNSLTGPSMKGSSRIKRAFQDIFAVSRNKQIRLRAANHIQRLAKQCAGDRKFVFAQFQIKTCRDPLRPDGFRCRRQYRASRHGHAPRAPAPRDGDWARCRRRPVVFEWHQPGDRQVGFAAETILAMIAPAVI